MRSWDEWKQANLGQQPKTTNRKTKNSSWDEWKRANMGMPAAPDAPPTVPTVPSAVPKKAPTVPSRLLSIADTISRGLNTPSTMKIAEGLAEGGGSEAISQYAQTQKALDTARKVQGQAEKAQNLVAQSVPIILDDKKRRQIIENAAGRGIDPLTTPQMVIDGRRNTLNRLMDEAGNDFRVFAKLAEDRGYDVIRDEGFLADVENIIGELGQGFKRGVRGIGTQIKTGAADTNIYQEGLDVMEDAPQYIKDQMGDFADKAKAFSEQATQRQVDIATEKIDADNRKSQTEAAVRSVEFQNVSKFGEYGGKIAQQVGRLAPAIGVSVVSGGLGAPQALASALSTFTFGTAIKGDTMQDLIGQGYDYQTADQAATMTAILEMGLESLSGGIGGSQPLQGLSGKIGQGMRKVFGGKLGKFLTKTVGNFVGEGTEEFIAHWVSPLVARITHDPNAEFGTWKGALQDFVDGGMVSLVLGAFGTADPVEIDKQLSQPDPVYDAAVEAATDFYVSPEGVAVRDQVRAQLPAPVASDPSGDVVSNESMLNTRATLDVGDGEFGFSVGFDGRDAAMAELILDKASRDAMTPQEAADSFKQDAPTYDELVQELADTIWNDEYLRGGHGVSLIQPDYYANYNPDARTYRESRNPIWYQEYYKKHGVVPNTRYHVREAAAEMLAGGLSADALRETGFNSDRMALVQNNAYLDRIAEQLTVGGANPIGIRATNDGDYYVQYGARGGYAQARGRTDAPYGREVQMRASEAVQDAPTVPRAQKAENVTAYQEGRQAQQAPTVPKAQPVERSTPPQAVQAAQTSEAQTRANTQSQAENAATTTERGGRRISTKDGEIRIKEVPGTARGMFDTADSKMMRRVERIGKRLGVNVKWAYAIQSQAGSSNGVYVPNENAVYLALDSAEQGDVPVYAAILGHEISHSLEGTSAYKAIMAYAVSRAKQRGAYDGMMDNLRQQYGAQTETYLQQELVAETVKEVFADEAELRRLVNSQRGVVGAILNALDRVIAKLKGRDVGEFTQMRKMLQDALNENAGTQQGEARQSEVRESRRTSNVPGSIRENPNLTAESRDAITVETEKGTYDYEVASNKQAIERANEELQKHGVSQIAGRIAEKVERGTRFNSEDIALAEAAMIEANRLQDKTTFYALASNLRIILTEAGQNVQIAKLLKTLTPEGRYMSVQRMVDLAQKRVNQHFKDGSRKRVTIKADPALVDALLNAETQKEAEIIERQIARNVGEQIPPRLIDKINAWRYLMMLGNIRTHARNITGNTAMYLLGQMKDLTGAAIEGVVPMKKRTKTLFNPFSQRALNVREFAASDALAMVDYLQSGGREGRAIRADQYMRVFKNKLLQGASQINTNALEYMDAVFLKLNYAKAMRQYMMANKLTPAQIQADSATLTKARHIATNEALRNTFRDASAFADALNKLSRTNWGASLLIEGLMPFKRTPMNILKRGVEYSPVGVLNAVLVESGKIGKTIKTGSMAGQTYTAQMFIDKLAAGLSGSGVVALGYFLASLGLLRASGSDRDREELFLRQQGRQPYSLEIFGKSITLGWLSPVNMPLMVGVEMFNLFDRADDPNLTFARLLDGLTTVGDPLMQLSMMQGLNNALQSFTSGQAMGSIGQVAGSAIASYVGQFFPTLGGQINRSLPGSRRTTYAAGDSEWNKGVESFARTLANKVPGMKNLLEPYVDMWGQEDDGTDNMLARIVENMVLPWYTNDIEDADEVNIALEKLYMRTGQISVLPKFPKNYYTGENGRTYYIKSAEIDEYRKDYGRTARKSMEGLLDSGLYELLDDKSRVTVVGKIYQYAGAYALERSSIPYAMNDEMTGAKSATRQGIDVETYFAVRRLATTNDETASVSQPDAKAAIDKVKGLTKEQRAYMWWTYFKKPGSAKNNPYIRGYQP